MRGGGSIIILLACEKKKVKVIPKKVMNDQNAYTISSGVGLREGVTAPLLDQPHR